MTKSPQRSGVRLEARGLRKTFEGGLVVALRNADLLVEPGERVAIMGPTGCGKSTLLNLLALLETPDAGELRFDDQPARALRPWERFRRSHVGLVFQFHHLLPYLTAAENIALPLAYDHQPEGEKSRRVEQLLDALGLAHRKATLAARLSGGERQLVALARALAHQPRLLLADEPTGSVDSQTGKRLLDFLFAETERLGTTVILVTHDADVARRTDRIVPMKDGVLPAPT